MTRNRDVANVLYEIAQLLEIQGVAFKPRAYQRAAMNIEALGEDIEQVVREGRLDEIPGVGKAIAEKVTTFLETGKLAYLDQLRKELPKGLVELLTVPGVGPKSALRLEKELGIHSLKELESAAKAGRIRALKGFGEKSEREILDGIAQRRAMPQRMPYPSAYEACQDLLAFLRAIDGVSRVDYAGSLRRGRDTVGDLDLLAIAPAARAGSVVSAFKKHRDVERVLESGETRSRVLMKRGLQVDLRIVPPESFGAALQYFTGSKDHNIALRTLALRKGWTINEYALSRKKDGRRLAGATEEEIYEKLGLRWIPPELRENHGEIEAARHGRIPALVELSDITGDLHTHTSESDGAAPLSDMVDEAQTLGYGWYGVSDHSQGLGIARGLDATRYARQRRAIDSLQKKRKIRILHGAEVNIRKDGRLDLEPKTSGLLDYIVGSVHSSFDLSEKDQTARVVRAIESGIDVLGHPSGRLLGTRPGIKLDWDAVFDAAKKRGVTLEVSASPFRLDLNGERASAARERGLLFAIDSDAHTRSGLRAMHYGITQARRGGLEAKHVITTFGEAAVLKHLGHARRR